MVTSGVTLGQLWYEPYTGWWSNRFVQHHEIRSEEVSLSKARWVSRHPIYLTYIIWKHLTAAHGHISHSSRILFFSTSEQNTALASTNLLRAVQAPAEQKPLTTRIHTIRRAPGWKKKKVWLETLYMASCALRSLACRGFEFQTQTQWFTHQTEMTSCTSSCCWIWAYTGWTSYEKDTWRWIKGGVWKRERTVCWLGEKKTGISHP